MKNLIAVCLLCGMLTGCSPFCKPEMTGLEKAAKPVPGSIDEPVKRWRKFWMPRYQEKLKQARAEGKAIRVVLLGDSITHYWETRGPKTYQEVLKPYHPLNLGFSGDRTQHTLWIIEQKEPWDHIRPDLAFVMIGTNNIRHTPPDSSPAATAEAVRIGVEKLHKKMPEMTIVVFGVFPSGNKADDPNRAKIREMNRYLAKWIGDGRKVFFVNIHDKFLMPDGTLESSVMPDYLHPSEAGYRIWAEAMRPYLEQLDKKTPITGEKQ